MTRQLGSHSDSWPTDDMLTEACIAAQGWHGITIGAAHAIAQATVDAAPTVDGWVWCDEHGVKAVVRLDDNDPTEHEGSWGGCPGPHRSLLLGPACEETNDG